MADEVVIDVVDNNIKNARVAGCSKKMKACKGDIRNMELAHEGISELTLGTSKYTGHEISIVDPNAGAIIAFVSGSIKVFPQLEGVETRDWGNGVVTDEGQKIRFDAPDGLEYERTLSDDPGNFKIVAQLKVTLLGGKEVDYEYRGQSKNLYQIPAPPINALP